MSGGISVFNGKMFLDVYIAGSADMSYRVTKRHSTGEWTITQFRSSATGRLQTSDYPVMTQEQHDMLLRIGMNAAAVKRLTE